MAPRVFLVPHGTEGYLWYYKENTAKAASEIMQNRPDSGIECRPARVEVEE